MKKGTDTSIEAKVGNDADSPTPAGARSHQPLGRLLPLAVIVAGLAAFFVFGLDERLSLATLSKERQTILEWGAENYLLAVLSFIGVYFLVVTLSLPGAVWMTLAGGFLFGTVPATVFVVVGATMGATALFLAVRHALGDPQRTRAGPWMQKMEAGFQDNALSYLLVLRLIPLFPFWLVNLAPAFFGVGVRTFVVGTLFGIIPGSFVYASVGSGLGAVLDQGGAPDLGIILAPRVILPIIGLATLAMLPVVYKKLRADGSHG